MKRRAVLATLGTTTTALAGCVAGDSDRPDGNRTNNGDEDDRTPSADGDSVVARFDGGPVRPECERKSKPVEVEFDDELRTFETAELVPYPEAPVEFSRREVVEYVEAFEHAYVTHDVLCDRDGSGHIFTVGYDVRRSETFDWYDEITVVALLRAGGAASGTDGGGNVWEADIAYDGVAYAVDESGVARAGFDGAHALDSEEFESEAPDPLDDGELVAVFE